jgi:hypothetical protein
MKTTNEIKRQVNLEIFGTTSWWLNMEEEYYED